MNKQQVDAYIPRAYQVLADVGIATGGRIPSEFRGYISSFGAAVTMGSLRSAIAFSSKATERTESDRTKLMKAIYLVINNFSENETVDSVDSNSLLKRILDDNANQVLWKENILNAAIALKLAMNMYILD